MIQRTYYPIIGVLVVLWIAYFLVDAVHKKMVLITILILASSVVLIEPVMTWFFSDQPQGEIVVRDSPSKLPSAFED